MLNSLKPGVCLHAPGMAISDSTADLIGVVLASLAYGAYLVILPHTIIVLNRRRMQSVAPPVWLWVATLLIFVLTTMFFVAELQRVVNGFEQPDTAQVLILNSTNASNQIKVLCFTLLIIVTDFIIVYRTYVIWNRNILVSILPLALLGTDIALAIWLEVQQRITPGGVAAINASVTSKIKYFYGITLCLNVICAGLISWRILRIRRALRTDDSRLSGLKQAAVIIIESASVYCTFLIALIAVDAMGGYDLLIFGDMLPPVMAVVFSLVIVRASKTTEESTTLQSSAPVLSTMIQFDHSSGAQTQTETMGQVEVEVEIAQLSHDNRRPTIEAAHSEHIANAV